MFIMAIWLNVTVWGWLMSVLQEDDDDDGGIGDKMIISDFPFLSSWFATFTVSVVFSDVIIYVKN